MIEGVHKIELKPFCDSRGIFLKSFNSQMLEGYSFHRIEEYFFSKSKESVWRGMHLQIGEYASNRFIYCVEGNVLDFLLDLRPDSPTCKEVMEFNLNSEKTIDGVYVPAGVAHGFLSLVDCSEVHYISDKAYSSEHDTGVNALSIPRIANRLKEFKVIMSRRDATLPDLNDF